MTADAPIFAGIHSTLLDWLKDAVICAHNVCFAELHVFDQWCHLGTVKDHQELDQLSACPQFDRDTYRYLLKFLHKKNLEIIALH